MAFPALAPEQVLTGFGTAALAERAWSAKWSDVTDAAQLYQRLAPSVIDFETSGSTGEPQRWRRTRENVWREAAMLGELIAPTRFEAVVSFVSTRHLFGALCGIVMPACRGIPVWCRSDYVGPMPSVEQERIVVIATPWIFQLLLQNLDWVRGFDHVAVLYGGSVLPATAHAFLREAGPDRTTVFDVLGSTEAGGIAHRRWTQDGPTQWRLFPDVEFDFDRPPDSASPQPLVVRSPRLAARAGSSAPVRWSADDLVVPTGRDEFDLVGRIGRLAKVNGRRINLDEAEQVARSVLDCEDLALVAVADDAVGEHVELHVVLGDGTTVDDLDLHAAFRKLAVRPKAVRSVPRIERSALGKRIAPVPTTEA